MITENQINTFLEDGAVILDNVLEPSLIEFASESMDKLYAPYTQRETGIIGYVLGEAFESIYQHQNLELIAKRILNCKNVDFIASAVLHTKPNQLNYKNPEHVDVQFNINEWNQTPRNILFTFMIFLDDVTPDRAPTLVRLGSHMALARHYGDELPYRDNPTTLDRLPSLEYAPLTPLIGRKGQVAVSTTALIHTGSDNATDKARKILFVSFAPTGSNINFNVDMVEERHKFIKEMHSRFPASRKHLVKGTLSQLEDLLTKI